MFGTSSADDIPIYLEFSFGLPRLRVGQTLDRTCSPLQLGSMMEKKMATRMLAALTAVLIGTNWTFAQAPELVPAPTPLIDRTGISTIRPAGETTVGRDPQMWVSADYLFTFLRGVNSPPLVTTSIPGTARASAGILGAPGTSTLFGGFVNEDFRSGVRLGAGYWFNPEQTLGVEAGFTLIASQSDTLSANANDGSILARPIIDARDGTSQALVVAFPGTSTGSIDVRANSGNFYEAHVGLAEKALDTGSYRLYSLLGYRYYRYDERVGIQQTINPTAAPFVAGTQIVTNDNFHTRNEFHGLDLGFRSQASWNTLTLDVLTKLAVGRVNRTINIGGDQTITVPGVAPVTQTAGVLALATNSGVVDTGDWKVMPELGVTLNWQLRANVSLRLGYSFIFLNGVSRAADQIDTTINPNFLPGANPALGGLLRPVAQNIRADMWIQSCNVGLLWAY